jgi:hypothetical protein
MLDDDTARIGKMAFAGANRQHPGSILAGPMPENERRSGFRAAGVAASKIAVPIIGKRGGGVLVRLKSEWAAIVGTDWSDETWPIALGRDGVLKLRAASGVALELQHRAPLMIERINGFFGRPAITRLTLVQGPLPLAGPSTRPLLRPLAPAEATALDRRLSHIAEPELREALARLGRAMLAREG